MKENPIAAHRVLNDFFDEHRGEYVAVHVNTCFMGSSLILKYAKKYHIPARIYHSHNAGDMYPSKSIIRKWLAQHEYRNVIKYANMLLACSELAGEYMFPGNAYTIIPNSIEVDRFQFRESYRTAKRKELGIEQNDYLIGFVGRLQYQKNPLFLIDVFHFLLEKTPNAKLLVIGTGNLNEKMVEKIKQYHIADKVIMLGSRSDVNKFYSAMDCFVLPSRFEGLGIVLLEAQCSGCPCVATAGTIPTTVKVLNSFEFVEQENLDAWVKAIARMSEKRVALCDRSSAHKTIAEAGYDAKELAKIMQELYLKEE